MARDKLGKRCRTRVPEVCRGLDVGDIGKCGTLARCAQQVVCFACFGTSSRRGAKLAAVSTQVGDPGAEEHRHEPWPAQEARAAAKTPPRPQRTQWQCTDINCSRQCPTYFGLCAQCTGSAPSDSFLAWRSHFSALSTPPRVEDWRYYFMHGGTRENWAQRGIGRHGRILRE